MIEYYFFFLFLCNITPSLLKDPGDLIFDEFYQCVEDNRCGLEYICSISSQNENNGDQSESGKINHRYDILILKNHLAYELPIQYDSTGRDVVYDVEVDRVDNANSLNETGLYPVDTDIDKNTIIVCGGCVTYFYIHHRIDTNSKIMFTSTIRLFINKNIVQSIKLPHQPKKCLEREECKFSSLMCRKYKTAFFCNNYDQNCMGAYDAIVDRSSQCISTCLETYYSSMILKGTVVDPNLCLKAVIDGISGATGDTQIPINAASDDNGSTNTTTVFIIVIIVIVILAILIIGWLIVRHRRLEQLYGVVQT